MSQVHYNYAFTFIANSWPALSIADQQFGPNNVKVTLKWVENEVNFSRLSVFPSVDVRMTGNMTVQLTVPYDVQHNVSISVCSQPPTKVAELYYSRT